MFKFDAPKRNGHELSAGDAFKNLSSKSRLSDVLAFIESDE